MSLMWLYKWLLYLRHYKVRSSIRTPSILDSSRRSSNEQFVLPFDRHICYGYNLMLPRFLKICIRGAAVCLAATLLSHPTTFSMTIICALRGGKEGEARQRSATRALSRKR